MGDLEEARDAAQESLVKVCTRLRQFRGEAQFATWLHRLVVNTCRDRLARQRVRQTEQLSLEDEPAGEESDPSRAALLADKRRELAAALSRLCPSQRHAVVLRDVFGMTYEEISRAARMPVGTAKCYVHRARACLRGGWRKRQADESASVTPTPPLGRREIEQILPHRDPFLLIDEVVELEPGARVVARKVCRRTSGTWRGTFPAGRSCLASSWSRQWRRPARWPSLGRGEPRQAGSLCRDRRRPIQTHRRPGDELELTCELERVRGPVGRGKAKATVGGELAVRGTLTFAVTDDAA